MVEPLLPNIPNQPGVLGQRFGQFFGPQTITSNLTVGNGATITFVDTKGNTTQVWPTPAGIIEMYGGSTAPTGWLLCDGSIISRTTYATLFAAIGTNWGAGDGSTTFSVPNLLGRAPIGAGGAGAGLTARGLGTTGGEENHTLTTAESPAHSHDVQRGGTGVMQSGANLGISQGSGSGFGGSPNLTESSGGGGGHNNMQPWSGVTFVIKT